MVSRSVREVDTRAQAMGALTDYSRCGWAQHFVAAAPDHM